MVNVCLPQALNKVPTGFIHFFFNGPNGLKRDTYRTSKHKFITFDIPGSRRLVP